MAKKFSFATYDRKHLKNLLRRARDINSLFSDAARDGARIGEATGYTDPNGEFAFDKFPAVKQRVEELFKGLHDSLMLTVTEGNREEWLLSAAKNDALVDSKYSRAVKKFADRAEAWHEPHLEALEQFNARKERGMNLSDRVWRLTDQFKGELELALELGLGDGKSAADLSRDVREYLNEPHKLFRRVRNEKGQLRLSKAAAAYHPGQGVYRSSYKNALRLTATENNMAYRTADHERWQTMDFVIGIEIQLSNNHPVEDICDEMCGVYPKTFKFVGWHPFCRCIAVPKLADEDEFIARQQALIDGQELPQGGYAGEVTEMPQTFQDWVAENYDRAERAPSIPYFIKDNRDAYEISRLRAQANEAGAYVQEIACAIAELHGASVTPINFKSYASILRKVSTERLGNGLYAARDVKDAVRTTIIANERELTAIAEQLRRKAISDRHIKAQKTPLGYTGYLVNIKTPNGLIAEIQANSPNMIYAKESPEVAKAIIGDNAWNVIRKKSGLEGGLGHKYYEEWRLPTTSSKRKEELERISRTYYEHIRGIKL